jgi:hypothetical protein
MESVRPGGMGSIERLVFAVATLVLAVLSVLLALGTLPSRIEAQDTGRLVPWMISWGLAWVAAVCGVIVVAFLVFGGRRSK